MSATPEVPPVEIIPFGPRGEKLGITRYEIFQMAETYNAYVASAMEIYLTILFGYIVAMYLAGPKLSRVQYAIANTIFLVVMASYTLNIHYFLSWSFQWGVWDGPYGKEMFSEYLDLMPRWLDLVRVYLMFVLLIGLPLAAVWFGWRIRKNPPQDRLNLPEAMQ